MPAVAFDFDKILIRSSRDRRISREKATSMNLIALGKGFYVARCILEELPDKWAVINFINRARAWILTRYRHSKCIVIGHAACVVHGISTLSSLITIDLLHPAPLNSTTSTSFLPPVQLSENDVIPAITVRRHHRQLLSEPVTFPHGIRCCSLKDAAISTGVLDDTANSHVVMCGVLRILSRFDRREYDMSRKREDAVRKDLLLLARKLPERTRNKKHLSHIIEGADAACESVAERHLLWIMRQGGITEVCTQMKVLHDGYTFFTDFGIPDLRIAIEFDGRSKHGTDADDIFASLEAQQYRQKKLEAAGFTVLRFVWKDLRSPERIVAEIRLHMERAYARKILFSSSADRQFSSAPPG